MAFADPFNSGTPAIQMAKTKRNLTLEHVLAKFGDNSLSDSPFQGRGIRLSYDFGRGITNGFEFLERIIAEGQQCVFFPDTNIAIYEHATPFWNACQNYFEKHGKIRCALSVAVYSELLERLKDPWSNKEVAESLNFALHSEEVNWAQVVDPEQFTGAENRIPAIHDYLFLLSMRRRILKGIELGGHHDGATQSRSEAMNYVKNHFGERAAKFVKKANRDFERFGEHVLNDEAHIFTAIEFALEIKKPVAIVSSDADIFEAFYKIQYLLDTNYREMLVGSQISSGDFGDPIENPLGYDRPELYSDLTLYRKRDGFFRDILPAEFEVVPVHCFYLSPNGTLDWLTFNFETGMRKTLEIRSRNRGRSTDLFGDRNIHIQLWPISGRLSPYIGIMKDQIIEKDGCVFSKIEEALVLYDKE